MKYTLHENLSNRTGIISNLHGFVNRHLDTGFKSKWSGFWVPPHKFLDYYSVKINGLWLGPESLKATEYGDSFIFHHETDSLEIEERVSTPDGLPGFRLELELFNKTDQPKAVQTVLEAGVDIRSKSQDLGPRKYGLEKGKNRLTVANEDRKLMISSDQEFEVSGDRYTRVHHPGDKQRCFVPGELKFRHEIDPGVTKKLEIEFTTSSAGFGELVSLDQNLHGEKLGHSFGASVDSMKNLVYNRKGRGIIAGHPWFQSYWARDTFWTLLGLVDAGYFELSERILTNFAEKGLPGKIDLDSGESEEVPRSDTAPLFIIAADKLERHYGLTEELGQAQRDAMKRLETEDGVVQHPEDGTWMDTLDRTPAVDIQSLWLEAARIMGSEKQQELERGLEKFKKTEYMKDFLDSEAPRTINPAIPVMFGQVTDAEAEKYLGKINAEFSSRYGARTRSMADPGYKAYGYHTGSVWGLTTGWAAAANLRHGKQKQGINFLEKMTQFVDRDQVGAFPEVVNSETGELIGCPEQAWSAGMFVHVIDSYLLGIDVEGKQVSIRPARNLSIERAGKRIGEERMDLKVENGEVEILNDPELELDY